MPRRSFTLWVSGKVSISKKSELLIDGQVVLNDLDLDGAMRICASGELPSKKVAKLGAFFVVSELYGWFSPTNQTQPV